MKNCFAQITSFVLVAASLVLTLCSQNEYDTSTSSRPNVDNRDRKQTDMAKLLDCGSCETIAVIDRLAETKDNLDISASFKSCQSQDDCTGATVCVKLGEFGSACLPACQDSQCHDEQQCIWTKKFGPICVPFVMCEPQCPQGWVCDVVDAWSQNDNSIYGCFPVADLACRPCDVPSDCLTEQAACVAAVDQEKFCFPICESTSDCLEGFDCKSPAAQAEPSTTDKLCLPLSGTCTQPE